MGNSHPAIWAISGASVFFQTKACGTFGDGSEPMISGANRRGFGFNIYPDPCLGSWAKQRNDGDQISIGKVGKNKQGFGQKSGRVW